MGTVNDRPTAEIVADLRRLAVVDPGAIATINTASEAADRLEYLGAELHKQTMANVHEALVERLVESEGCCDECHHVSHSNCLACGMPDRECMAILWPETAGI